MIKSEEFDFEACSILNSEKELEKKSIIYIITAMKYTESILKPDFDYCGTVFILHTHLQVQIQIKTKNNDVIPFYLTLNPQTRQCIKSYNFL